MEDHLYCKDLYEPTESDATKPKKMLEKVWKKIKKKTLVTIRQCIDLSIYNQVSKESDLHTLWKNFENMYQKKNARGKSFHNKKIDESKTKRDN